MQVILILGANGMLGHVLCDRLRTNYELVGTVRGRKRHSLDGVVPIIEDVDVRRSGVIARVLAAVRPTVVVNTVGIVKQRPEAADIRACIEVNALFPHRLEVLCELAKSRLIHISTDCVYSGAQGMYREEMPADPKDVYGSTKWLGEVADHAITLRTSIIGVELERRSGLVEWALRAGDPVPGYTRAIYSGLTTAALADVIKQVIDEPRLTGLYHVSSEPISKYDLLRELFAQIGVEKRVIADNTFVCDRSLDSTRFRQTTGWTPPSWPSMLRNLAQEIRERGDE